MATLQELDIPKKYKKNKKIRLYKAFMLKDGDSMSIHTDIEILSLDYQSAVQYLLSSIDILEIQTLKGRTINFTVFIFNTDDILTKPLVDEGAVYYQDLNVSITLKNKLYKINVEDHLIEEIEVEIDPKTEQKTITSLTLTKIT